MNYLGRGEYRTLSPAEVMTQPYGRLVIMHLTILRRGVRQHLDRDAARLAAGPGGPEDGARPALPPPPAPRAWPPAGSVIADQAGGPGPERRRSWPWAAGRLARQDAALAVGPRRSRHARPRGPRTRSRGTRRSTISADDRPEPRPDGDGRDGHRRLGGEWPGQRRSQGNGRARRHGPQDGHRPRAAEPDGEPGSHAHQRDQLPVVLQRGRGPAGRREHRHARRPRHEIQVRRQLGGHRVAGARTGTGPRPGRAPRRRSASAARTATPCPGRRPAAARRGTRRSPGGPGIGAGPAAIGASGDLLLARRAARRRTFGSG